MFTRIYFGFRFPAAVLLLCLCHPLRLTSASDSGTNGLQEAGHVLNRIAYGPSTAELARVHEIGVQTYIEEQLNPAGIDETGNLRLRQREETLFTVKLPIRETPLVMAGEFWSYHKGTSEAGRYVARRTDYRAVFGEIFTRHFGDSAEILEQVIPGYFQAMLDNPADFEFLNFLPQK